MVAWILGFLAGACILQLQPSLPGSAGLAALCVLGLPVAFLCARRGHGVVRTGLLCTCGFVIGFGWAAARAEWRMADRLVGVAPRDTVRITGVIEGLPQLRHSAWQFVLRVESAAGLEEGARVPSRVQLNWFPKRDGAPALPELAPGQRWELAVRLRPPHGFSNPHGFDYEGWLLQRNIRATGTVRERDLPPQLLDATVPGFMHTVHRLRDAVRQRFRSTLGDAPYAGVLIALAIGDQQAIPAAQWDVFRRTGVTHLMSISGLHVSMVGLLIAWLATMLWRRVPALMLRVPLRRAAGGAVLAGVLAYSLMAGMGIATQRALLMISVGVGVLLFAREIAASRVLAFAVIAVLVADPWAVLAPGFWLSFAAVAVIALVVAGRRPAIRGWWAAVRVQTAITVALAPLLLGLFLAYPLISPLANGIAIPLVSFVVTPLVLIAMCVPADALLSLAHVITSGLMWTLETLAQLPHGMWRPAALPAGLLLVALAGVLWVLLPRGAPARWLGVVALVPALIWSPPRPEAGYFTATLLDVGHGLAVHVATAGHSLLFDTGPRYGQRADAGERVLVPYLLGEGVRSLDMLLLSHDDIDHTGGAASLLDQVSARAVMVSMPIAHIDGQRPSVAPTICRAGSSWTWDGVRFEILGPVAAGGTGTTVSDNDQSCVLRVSTGEVGLLVTGDVEAAGERALLARGAALQSEVVVVPHHGSRSSSSRAFVDAVRPAHALFSVGVTNPFGHPHPEVLARWQGAGARLWRSDRDGAIIAEFGPDGVNVVAQRLRAPRYWHAAIRDDGAT